MGGCGGGGGGGGGRGGGGEGRGGGGVGEGGGGHGELRKGVKRGVLQTLPSLGVHIAPPGFYKWKFEHVDEKRTAQLFHCFSVYLSRVWSGRNVGSTHLSKVYRNKLSRPLSMIIFPHIKMF